MQCFFQFWGKARDGLLELYKPVNIVQCRSHNSHNTKYNTYSCLWSAVKRCSEIAEGWSYPYFLSTMNLEMCCVILSTGLCFCATGFIRPPWGLFDGTFWVFTALCVLGHLLIDAEWKGDALQCLSFCWLERITFLLSPGQDFLGISSYYVWRGRFLSLCKKK